MKDVGDLLKLMARRYEILEHLYPDKEMFLTELSEKSGISLGNLSKYAKELHENNLIQIDEREKTNSGGRPYKYCSLTTKGSDILSSINNAVTAVRRTDELLTKDKQIACDVLTEMLENEDFSEEFRYFIANELMEVWREDPVGMMEYPKMKKLFVDIILNPPEDDEIGGRLRAIISLSISRLIFDEKASTWVTNFYSKFSEHAMDIKKNENVRKWAISRLGDIIRLTSNTKIQNKIFNKLLDLYFSEEETMGNKIEEETRYIIRSLNFQQDLFEKVKSKTKDPRLKVKGESLLKEMIRSLRR